MRRFLHIALVSFSAILVPISAATQSPVIVERSSAQIAATAQRATVQTISPEEAQQQVQPAVTQQQAEVQPVAPESIQVTRRPFKEWFKSTFGIKDKDKEQINEQDNVISENNTHDESLQDAVTSMVKDVLEDQTDSLTIARRDSADAARRDRIFMEMAQGILNDEPLVEVVMEEAFSHLGKPYVYGANGPNSFDCSGFTKYCYNKIGIKLHRTADDQAYDGRPVGRNELRRGDIILFGARKNPRTIGHVGMVVEFFPETGRFRFIHAANNGVELQWSDMSYYAIRYLGARRIVE